MFCPSRGSSKVLKAYNEEIGLEVIAKLRFLWRLVLILDPDGSGCTRQRPKRGIVNWCYERMIRLLT